MLRIKQDINKDVLTNVYGFKKEQNIVNPKICYYFLEEEYSYTLIHYDGSISSVIPSSWDTDTTSISDVIFKLIKDDLVEMV